MDSKQSIKQLYDEGMAEVFKIVGSFDADDRQRAVAQQTAKDLSSMLVAHTLQTIEGRTALLAGLIVELNQVTETVKVKSPYEGALAAFTGIVTKAQALFQKEKASLV